MAALGDVDASRQTVVLSYQFGIGMTNFIIPTNGVLMMALTIVKIPWLRFINFIMPLFVVLWLISAVAVPIVLYVFPA